MTEVDILKECRVEGNNVFLPEIDLDRKLYLQVSKRLELIGGDWNRKIKGFIFPSDPSKLLGKVSVGEKVNLKKEFQFFATPPELAEVMVELAEIEAGHSILEPSAGQGAIIKAINKTLPRKMIFCYEKMPINLEILKTIKEANILGEDFEECILWSTYDRIIANPPFRNNQDIVHIQRMYEMLKFGGRMVTLSSPHWEHSETKKCLEFREWLDNVNAEVMKVEKGSFKSSGTMIETRLIIINK